MENAHQVAKPRTLSLLWQSSFRPEIKMAISMGYSYSWDTELSQRCCTQGRLFIQAFSS